jgi:uncharacterized protein (TIGR03435 family)
MTFANLAFLENHLWQSTLCAATAWLLILALRKNRAAIRYWVWFAASLKFLVPLSLLVAIGSWFGWRTAGFSADQTGALQWTTMITSVGRPFAAPTAVSQASAATAARWVPSLSIILVVIWFGGFVVTAYIWIRNWMRARVIERRGTRLSVSLPIPAVSSRTPIEPGLFGILRPVLLVPEGITTRLTAKQFEAILEHEMCHLRRRDNLLAAIQMAIQAIFWFYPPIWWIGARMVDERERACDEEVLRLGTEPEPYAEAILNVCKFCTESPLACASRISGADLKSRIVRIMKQGATHELSFGRKALLASAIVVALAGPLILGAVNAPLRAQSQSEGTDSGPLPSFEVISIKLNRSDGGRRSIGFRPGRFTTIGAPAKLLIQFAYNLQSDSEISGGPSWINFDKYDIDAKIEDAMAEKLEKLPPEQRSDSVRLMVQSLLADRFQLKVSHTTKELPVYALVIAKNGPKLTRAKDPGPSGFHGASVERGKVTFSDAPVSLLARFLSEQAEFGRRMVIDQTGLTDKYDFTLQWTPETLTPAPGEANGVASPALVTPPATDSSAPSIFTAVDEQLGLKLESRKAPVEILVVDHIEHPSEN